MFQKHTWDKLWIENDFEDWDDGAEVVFHTLKKEIGPLKGKKILEAGSGTGRISLRLALEGAEVSLLDFSETAIIQSQNRFNIANQKGHFICSDLFNMKDIPDETYDVVWNAGVLEHFSFEQQCRALQEMKRVLKSDGLIITLNPNAKCVPYSVGKWFMESTDNWNFGQELPIYTLQPVFKQIGCSLLKEYSVGFVQSLFFLTKLPGSEILKKAFEKWYLQLSDEAQEATEGYLLVSICQKASVMDLTDEDLKWVQLREPCSQKSIVILGSIHYTNSLWQRPQHLASQFSKMGYKVIFINQEFLPIRTSGTLAELNQDEVSSIYRKMFLEAKMVDGVYVIDQIDYVIDKNGQQKYVNDEYIVQLMKFFGVSNADIICYLPKYAAIAKELKQEFNSRIFYDCVDDMTGFYETKKVIKDELDLLEIADGIVVTSKTLYVRKSKLNQNCILIQNGLPYGYFEQEREEPNDIKILNGPVIGYVGAIADWFDQELVVQMAKMKPDWQFVLVGTVYTSIEKLKNIDNIHLYGKREYNLVPAYMQHFDVGIIPFKMNELIVNTNPIKYYEYVASKLPTVSVPMPELMGEKYVRLAKDAKHFIHEIENLMQEEMVIEDESFLLENSWENRAKHFIKFMEEEFIPPSRNNVLKEFLRQYEEIEDSFPLLDLLEAEIHQELGEGEQVVLKAFSKNGIQDCMQLQLRLALEQNDHNLILDVVELFEIKYMNDLQFWYEKGTDFLECHLRRKAGDIQWLLRREEDYLVKHPVLLQEELGNLMFELEELEKAAIYYVKVYQTYGKVHTCEAAINFARIALLMSKKELALEILSPFEGSYGHISELNNLLLTVNSAT